MAISNKNAITSYAQCKALWRTCANPEKGKPVGPFRMFAAGDGFNFFYGRRRDKPLVTVLPANKLRLNYLGRHGERAVMQSMFGIFHRSPGKLRVEVGFGVAQKYEWKQIEKKTDERPYGRWGRVPLDNPPAGTFYHEGMTFDFATGACITADRAPNWVVDADKRKLLQSKVRRVDRVWRTLVRMGAITLEDFDKVAKISSQTHYIIDLLDRPDQIAEGLKALAPTFLHQWELHKAQRETDPMAHLKPLDRFRKKYNKYREQIEATTGVRVNTNA